MPCKNRHEKNVPKHKKCSGTFSFIVREILIYLAPSHPATVLARLTWASKLNQGAEPGAVVKKELALSGIQRPLYPGELGEDAVEVFRFGDFAGWLIEG